MERREFLKQMGLFSFGVAGLNAIPSVLKSMNSKSDRLPNIVFILADDMGWNQVGYGGTDFYETPNIDNIAKSGMYFTNAYAPAPTCSPSRAGIMTGKYPARIHLTEYIPGDPYPWAKLKAPQMVEKLPLEEITIAELLRPFGYVSAMIGKWHLNIDKNYQLNRPGDPLSQGFDYVHTTVKPEDDANPFNDAHHAIEITNEAIKFINQNKNRPFFLFVGHHIVHRPIMEHSDLIYKYQEKKNSDLLINNPIMGAMIERMDSEIGRLLRKIDELKLKENTIVIFMSDNGGYDKLQAQNPLRGGKSMLYEGGIRIPLAIRWPGVIKPNTYDSTPVCGIDLFPTFAEILGEEKISQSVDGISILPLIKQSGKLNRESIYWHYPHYHRFGYKPSGAIREGKYKLIEWYERSFFNEENPVSLFDLENDIGEKNDIANQNPQLVNELWAKLKKWRKEINAQEMTQNPNFDPNKALFWKENVDPDNPKALGQYY